MITEIIKKDFSYTKRVNISFLIIISALTFWLCVPILMINKLNISVDTGIKNIFLMRFIFALSYSGGPQFFANLRVAVCYLPLKHHPGLFVHHMQDLEELAREIYGADFVKYMMGRLKSNQALLRQAEETGVILLQGKGFASPNMTMPIPVRRYATDK